jgi:hypothetical protein
MTTPKLGLTELVAAQNQPEIPINQALRALDQIEQMSVASILNTPPGSPVDGDAYIVDTSPTGAWSGHAQDIAYFVAGTFNEWRFMTPNSGWLAYVVALDKFYYYKASTTSWIVTAII